MSLFKIFKTLILIIFLVDLFNIDLVIGDFSLAYFLDKTFAINFWFWSFFWFFVPTSENDFILELSEMLINKLKENEND